MPGGVSSPVRAFKSVGGQPIVFDRVKGAYAWDVDGNRYIDYIGSWGPAICGHSHPELIAALNHSGCASATLRAKSLSANTCCAWASRGTPAAASSAGCCGANASISAGGSGPRTCGNGSLAVPACFISAI